MTARHYQPIANGLRTDHPIPDLAFVDDQHIPVEDAEAIEAIGRHREDMWGRRDKTRDGGWVAFTTDPLRHDLAWLVRWHPEHGRTVAVYRDAHIADVHTDFYDTAILYRSGGYWWDGVIWYRPSQVWDRSTERFLHRPVPAARSVSAADLLTSTANASKAAVVSVLDLDPDEPKVENWNDHLALWAQRFPDLTALDRCVVKLSAPELAGEELLAVPELARIGALAASTVRAYLTRGQGDLPDPQAVVGGRPMWSRPVAEDWAEQRSRDPEAVQRSVSVVADSDPRGQDGGGHPIGIAGLWDRYTKVFTSQMWQNPRYRKRFAVRWRSETAAQEIARDLAWTAAAGIPRIVPVHDIATAVQMAILYEVTDLHHSSGPQPHSYGFSFHVTKSLDWLIRYAPDAAASCINGAIGEAKDKLGIDNAVMQRTIRAELSMHGELTPQARRDFLDRVFPPAE